MNEDVPEMTSHVNFFVIFECKSVIGLNEPDLHFYVCACML